MQPGGTLGGRFWAIYATNATQILGMFQVLGTICTVKSYLDQRYVVVVHSLKDHKKYHEKSKMVDSQISDSYHGIRFYLMPLRIFREDDACQGCRSFYAV